jgi:hypothetical protein
MCTAGGLRVLASNSSGKLAMLETFFILVFTRHSACGHRTGHKHINVFP